MRIAAIALLACLAAPVAAQDKPEVPVAPEVTDKSSPDYMRCRRIAATGSLARKEKVCKSNAEWERIAKAGNDSSREALERSQSLTNVNQ